MECKKVNFIATSWVWIGPVLAAAAGLSQIGLLFYIVAHRIHYPFDLEWMEGGMICHALRVLEGKPIYAPPSADFISYLYTPFYPFLLGQLGKIFGLSYFLGRILSCTSFVTVLLLLFRAVQRQAGGGLWGALWGIAAIGLIASSFPLTGAWYDLVRSDSLYMALIVGNLYLLGYHHRNTWAVILAAILASLAFLTKQTASIFIIFSGLALLVMNWRRLPIYVALVGLIAGGSVLVLNHFSDGWFWRYIYGMHQGHDLYWIRIWPETEIKLFRFFPAVGTLLGLWVLLVPLGWLIRRQWPTIERTSLFWFSVALTGVAVSAIGFATQWASENAFIPGLILPAAFSAMACAQIARMLSSNLTKRLLLAGLVGLLLGGGLVAQMVTQLYKPAPHLPTRNDWNNGKAMIARLQQIPGPVLMPYHPYYPVLAGKRPSYHQMGINDVTRAGYPFPEEITRRVAARYYQEIILDNPAEGRYDFMVSKYHLADTFPANIMPRVFTGYIVRPTFRYVPTPASAHH